MTRVVMQVGTLDLDADLEVAPGEVVALVGPNGAGKSTLLQALAGTDPDVGLVFQDRLLFPHMTALDNVAFGLRQAGLRKRQARAEAHDWLRLLGMDDVSGLRPHALSGGQAQRVAIARAMARRPALLLLDEPFAALDVDAHAEVRQALRAALTQVPDSAVVLVTHQPVEVLAMAQRIVVLENGRIVQEGTVAEVTARPRSQWAARMAGLNLVDGVGVFHPRSVALSRDRPNTTARNVWRGTVAGIDHQGDRVRVRVDGYTSLVAEITAASANEMALATGQEVWASVKATEVDPL
jgi:molybdate transport system ATP-binding protein